MHGRLVCCDKENWSPNISRSNGAGKKGLQIIKESVTPLKVIMIIHVVIFNHSLARNLANYFIHF